MTVDYWEPIATPSSHLEPPDPDEICGDCEEWMDECICNEPRCEDCNKVADRLITVDDCEGWVCNECAKQYESEAAK